MIPVCKVTRGFEDLDELHQSNNLQTASLIVDYVNILTKRISKKVISKKVLERFTVQIYFLFPT